MRTIPGVVVGIVKDLDDPKGLGRVRLEFPWVNQSYRTDWVSIATPLAGNKRGQFFMPVKDDEVLVAFEQGDFDHPYVIGFLWNGVDKPPETELKNRVILTPGGHTLRFEDKDGAKKVVLKSNGGHKVELDDDGQTITVSDSKGDNHVTIQIEQGNITIQAKSKVTVEAPEIKLVKDSTHPLVFGDKLLTYLQELVTALNTHTHTAQFALGIFPVTPGPPTPPPFNLANKLLLSEKTTTG